MIKKWITSILKPLCVSHANSIVSAMPCVCDTNRPYGSGRIGVCNRCITIQELGKR